MGAHSFRERHALQLHRQINEDAERDPFDADYDPAEVPRVVPVRDDLSFRFARLSGLPTIDPVEARKKMAEVKKLIRCQPKAEPDVAARQTLAAIRCWHDTPELYRRMVARAAGLPGDVVGKIDRDLSEREKELIRSAVRDMRGYFDSLVRL